MPARKKESFTKHHYHDLLRNDLTLPRVQCLYSIKLAFYQRGGGKSFTKRYEQQLETFWMDLNPVRPQYWT